MPVSANLPGPWGHRDVTANGARFHVALSGPQPQQTDNTSLIVLLHGFPECWWTWRHLLPALGEAGYRCAAIDLRGFGGSDRPPSGYDLVTLAQDISGVVRSLGYTQAVIVGHGLGGQVAWMLPAVAPDLVQAIVPVAAPHPAAMRSVRSRLLSGAALQYLSLQVPAIAERSIASQAGLDKLLRSWATVQTQASVSEGSEYYSQLLARPGAAHSALETLRNTFLSRQELSLLEPPVQVPVFSVQGQLDPVTPAQASARDLHRVEGHLRQATVRGVGHFPQEEAPQKLTELLLSFFTELQLAPQA